MIRTAASATSVRSELGGTSTRKPQSKLMRCWGGGPCSTDSVPNARSLVRPDGRGASALCSSGSVEDTGEAGGGSGDGVSLSAPLPRFRRSLIAFLNILGLERFGAFRRAWRLLGRRLLGLRWLGLVVAHQSPIFRSTSVRASAVTPKKPIAIMAATCLVSLALQLFTGRSCSRMSASAPSIDW
jgi:hypothetical protein